MDITTFKDESSPDTKDDYVEVEAYVSVSTDNEELAGLFHELMEQETVTSDNCMETVKVTFSGCDESVTFDAGDIEISSSGSILRIDLTLHDVCPDKRVALAVVLTEVDSRGREHSRGMQTMTVPAHHKNCNDDIKVSCIRFVLPNDLTTERTQNSKCSKRNFKARIMTNYVDNNFLCCNMTM